MPAVSALPDSEYAVDDLGRVRATIRKGSDRGRLLLFGHFDEDDVGAVYQAGKNNHQKMAQYLIDHGAETGGKVLSDLDNQWLKDIENRR